MNKLAHPNKADVWYHSESKHHFYTVLSMLVVMVYLVGLLLSVVILPWCRYITPVLPVVWFIINLKIIHWKSVLDDLAKNPNNW